MNLLGFDTSGGVCSVAVSAGDKLLSELRADNGLTHSQILMPMIDEAVRLSGLEKEDLEAVVVSEGPGSFTGLRIGAATAKGLCFALDIPLIAVQTLPAMALQCAQSAGVVCPMMDARRNQVYAGIYRFEKEHTDGLPVTLLEGAPLAVEELVDRLHERDCPVTFLGDGVPVYEELLKGALRVPFTFALPFANRQSAAALNTLAALQLRADCANIMQADVFSPVYLRPAQAERENVLLRPMSEKDVDGALRLEQASFSRPWTRDMLVQAMTEEESVALVAVTGEKIVGTCFVKNIAGEGNITNVNVDINFRRQGIGEALLKEVLEEGRGIGIDAFTLEVRTGNLPARRLYEACGFVSEGVRPSFYEDPKEDAAIYWLR